jgi:hypothetical protein
MPATQYRPRECRLAMHTFLISSHLLVMLLDGVIFALVHKVLKQLLHPLVHSELYQHATMAKP